MQIQIFCLFLHVAEFFSNKKKHKLRFILIFFSAACTQAEHDFMKAAAKEKIKLYPKIFRKKKRKVAGEGDCDEEHDVDNDDGAEESNEDMEDDEDLNGSPVSE